MQNLLVNELNINKYLIKYMNFFELFHMLEKNNNNKFSIK